MHHHVSLETLSATYRCGPYQTSVDPFSAPKPPSGLFKPMTPPVHQPAPRKVPRTLALLLDRLSGRPSFSPAPNIGAPFLGSPHPLSDHCFPRAIIAPQLPLETVDSRLLLFSPVPVATSNIVEPPHCRANIATRAPSSPELRRHLSFATRALSSPELRRHLSFATRAPPSPEFHLSPELRRHPSFTTRYPPFSELHLRQRFVVTCHHLSFATRAPPSSELHL